MGNNTIAELDQNTKLLAEMVSVYARELIREKTFSETMITQLVLNYQVMMINIRGIFDIVEDASDDDNDYLGCGVQE